MYGAIAIFVASLSVSSLSVGKMSFASESTFNVETKTKISLSMKTREGPKLLQELAVALAEGGEALSRFRDSAVDNGEAAKRLINPGLRSLDCSIDRIANYVSCYGSMFESREEASRRFIQFINELQAVLPSNHWKGVEVPPGIGSIQGYTYEDQNSDAHIDIDLMVQLQEQGTYFYLKIFGWPATAAQH